MDALLRRRMMMLAGSPGPGPTPPPPAQNVPYIRGGADGSYIDTGITADNTVKVIVWARNWLPYSEGLFGSRTAANSDEFAISAISGADVDRARIRLGTSNAAFAENAITEVYSHYHKYEYSEGVFKVDDVVKATATAQTFSNNFNIHLFGINTGGTHTLMNFPVDICACKIYKNNVLVRDFAAVNSPSVGMYDSVSNTVFTNAGSGSFTYGTFNSNSYTPLQYIECTGEQYFDSGVKGTYSMLIVSKFRRSGTNQFANLFGYRGTSDWCEIYSNYGSSSTNIGVHFGTSSWQSLYSNANSSVLDHDFVIVKNNNVFTLYLNNAKIGNSQTGAASSSFVTTGNMFVGALNNSGVPASLIIGKIYYISFGLDRNFVPAEVNNVAGMYDTYNDIFHPSESGTPFIAGPTL